MAEDVLVIGAGPAGIACAYQLEKAGLSYKVIDKAHEIGSTWNRLYPSLRLNTSRFFSHLPEQKFPLSYGLFPTGKQYHAYLVDYVSKRNFNIHLGVEVHHVRQDGEGWSVETSEGNTWYPTVISASGRFNAPFIPRIDGMDKFDGEIIHAQDYLGHQAYVGKKMMVVGNGPSGIDIATELGSYAQAPVLLSQRTGVVLRPRYPWGLPKHGWKMISEMLPDFIGTPLYNRIQAVKYPDHMLQNIKTPPEDANTSAAGGTRGRAILRQIEAGNVKSVDGPARFHENSIELDNGDHVEADTVIMATGYRPVLYSYLDVDIVERDSQDWPSRLDDLDEGGMRQVKGYQGLFLVGVFYKGKGAMYNFNVEAKQAVTEIQARLRQITQTKALENA